MCVLYYPSIHPSIHHRLLIHFFKMNTFIFFITSQCECACRTVPLKQDVKLAIADSVADGGILGAALAARQAKAIASSSPSSSSLSLSSSSSSLSLPSAEAAADCGRGRGCYKESNAGLNKLVFVALISGIIGFALGSMRRR
jgi:hypothetical protein